MTARHALASIAHNCLTVPSAADLPVAGRGRSASRAPSLALTGPFAAAGIFPALASFPLFLTYAGSSKLVHYAALEASRPGRCVPTCSPAGSFSARRAPHGVARSRRFTQFHLAPSAWSLPPAGQGRPTLGLPSCGSAGPFSRAARPTFLASAIRVSDNGRVRHGRSIRVGRAGRPAFRVSTCELAGPHSPAWYSFPASRVLLINLQWSGNRPCAPNRAGSGRRRISMPLPPAPASGFAPRWHAVMCLVSASLTHRGLCRAGEGIA